MINKLSPTTDLLRYYAELQRYCDRRTEQNRHVKEVEKTAELKRRKVHATLNKSHIDIEV